MTSYHDADKKYNMFSGTAAAADKKRTFSISDDIVARNFQATAGSRMLEGYFPVFDSAVVSRMTAENSLIGTTNMDEFGFGMFSVSGTKIPKNPFDPERSCGGSCGGAACAASVLEDHVALGTSAGGSISSPAAFCGVFGLTPTFGRVSRYGQIDTVSSMGPVGIFASKSELLKKYLPVISGKDERDPTSTAQPELKIGKKKLRSVAVPKGVTDGVSDGVRKAFDDSVNMLKSMSVNVEYVDMPILRHAMPAHYILCATEATTNLAGYCGMRCGQRDGDLSLPFNDYFASFRSKYFGAETKLRIIIGTYATMGENRRTMYLRSLGVRKLAINSYNGIFKDHDAVLTPSMPYAAPKIADAVIMSSVDSYMASRFAAPPAFCGLPSVSVPCGYSDGLPVGMQFTACHWNEDVLLDAADLWERSFIVKAPEVSL
ncbi:MAG: amidase family protein [Methanomassiliicoccaceae archaeon]|nr:amidase family protein [Methanomassiliicoccaceae archaeon]